MKKIIIASPNSASESLSEAINKTSDHKCFQIVNIDLRQLINQKYKKKKLRKFICLLDYYLRRYSLDTLHNTSLKNYSPAKDYPKLAYYHNDITSFNKRLYRP